VSDTDRTMVAPGDPRAPIWDMIAGPWQFAALHALTELGCADYLAEQSLTAGELAVCCKAKPDRLARLLAWAVSTGLVKLTQRDLGEPGWHSADLPEPDCYTLTDAGHTLRSDSAGTMRAAVLSTGTLAGWLAMSGVAETIRTGKPAFDAQQGCSFYDYLSTDPMAARVFHEFMATRTADLASALSGMDFSDSLVVADIGGGYGIILAALLQHWPHLSGVLADHDHVLGRARGWLASAGIADRVRVMACDYLVPGQIPPADTYLLGSVLHNHDDRDVRAILGAIMAAACGSPRVLVAEILLPDDPVTHFGYGLDIRMMALGPGRERTRAAYLGLLGDVGLATVTVTSTPGAFSVIDARP
jgi:O-methyltransferase domain